MQQIKLNLAGKETASSAHPVRRNCTNTSSAHFGQLFDLWVSVKYVCPYSFKEKARKRCNFQVAKRVDKFCCSGSGCHANATVEVSQTSEEVDCHVTEPDNPAITIFGDKDW